jgi:hypothetical protein
MIKQKPCFTQQKQQSCLTQKQQSSCPCRRFPKGGKSFVQGYSTPITATSISTNGSDLPPQFEGADIQTFNFNQQPPVRGSRLTLPKSSKVCCQNPNFGMDKATDFNRKNSIPQRGKYNKNKRPHQPPCSNPQWSSLDSRLISTTHTPNFRNSQTLDSVPYIGEVPLSKIYDKNLTNYGKKYKSYKDIHAGQIRYYFDKDLTPVLFDPLFVIPSNVTSQLFVDPMSSRKFQTVRDPVLENNRNVSEYQFDRDQMEFRESIMHSQMAVMNQQDFNHVWGQENLN